MARKKVEYDRTQQRSYNWYDRRPVHGNVTLMIICPFCGTHVRAYEWSLAGGGKKCLCGALHTGHGITLPVKK